MCRLIKKTVKRLHGCHADSRVEIIFPNSIATAE